MGVWTLIITDHVHGHQGTLKGWDLKVRGHVRNVNHPAAGQPTISGTPRMGARLTADTSGIDDADGLTSVSYSYQWIRSDGNADSDIEGATNSTYVLSDDDVGRTIKVRVIFTDDAGNQESLTGEATEPVIEPNSSANNPATGLPAISGIAQVGEGLTADVSGIADADGLPATFTYVWWTTDDDGVRARVGGIAPAYTLRAKDKGKTVTVQVNFTDGAGAVESLTSEPTAAVVGSEPTELPHDLSAAVSGDAIVLTWKDAVNVPNYDFYQILRHRPELGEPEPLVYVNRVHSTAPTFTDTEVEPGVLYVYRVKAVVNWFGEYGEASLPAEIRMPDSGDNPEPDPTAPAETNTPATGLPTISGTAQVGEMLTADTSGIADGGNFATQISRL